MSETTVAPAADAPPARGSQRLYVLKEGDAFLVADACGDVQGEGDGLFADDTRVLSRLCLRIAGGRPALLSSGVSQDNVFFTAHLTNQPLPPLGATPQPEGLVHIERRRFLWQGRVFERVVMVNHGQDAVRLPLRLDFGADFRDMFEVRGMARGQRGQCQAAEVGGRGAVLRYVGLDGRTRTMAIDFSQPPQRLAADHAAFDVGLAPSGIWTLYLEIGPEPAAPGEARHRAAAVHARFGMRRRTRRGARLHASGRLFQAWLDKSTADLALLTTELPTGPYPYAGIPWFSTPFGRDAIVTALQTLWRDPELARGVLAFLAEHQASEFSSFRDAEPGKIMHETRKGEMAAVDELPFGRYYGGVDTTPLFVVLADAWFRRAPDGAFLARIWPALQAAADWIVRATARHPAGLLAYARAEESGLFNQGWKDSHDSVFHEDGGTPPGPIALVEVQGYVQAAYAGMARLAACQGESEAAARWAARAEAMREAVERAFWLEDLGFYALAVDGEGRPCRVRASNAGHLLYTGLPDARRGRAVARQLMSRAFASGWGIRTLATEAPRYNPMSYHNGSVWPHDAALCVAGLGRYGERDGVVHLFGAMFEAAVHFGMRLPELFCGFARSAGEAPVAYPVACLPQAWAAGSVFMLLQACLGLDVDGVAGRIVIDQPRLPTGIDELRIGRLQVGDECVDLVFQRVQDRVVAGVDPARAGRTVEVVVRL